MIHSHATSPELIGPVQEEWLQSLEQHPERQLKASLGSKPTSSNNGIEDYKTCCLGELGLISKRCEWVKDPYSTQLKLSAPNGNKGTLSEVYVELGLYTAEGGSRYDYPTGNTHILSLASLNDGGATWPEIAAIIRANPIMYIKSPV